MRIMTVFLALCFIVGCMSYGRKIDTYNIDKIKKGETTKNEVVSLIGSPDQIISDGMGNTIMQYTYIRVASKPQNFIPVVGAFTGGANTQNQSVVVTVGSDNIVSNIVSSYGASGTGMGVQMGSKAEIADVEENKRPK